MNKIIYDSKENEIKKTYNDNYCTACEHFST